MAQATTFTVTNLNDTGSGSLRQAISDSRDFVNRDDTIVFASGLTGTINLQSRLPDLTSPTNVGAASGGLVLQGPGAKLLTVRRDGGGFYRILNIPRRDRQHLPGDADQFDRGRELQLHRRLAR